MKVKNASLKILLITNIVTLSVLSYISVHDKVPQRFLNKTGIAHFEVKQKTYMDYRIQALHSLGSEKEGFDVIMLGDSITAEGDWEKLLPGIDVANYGISGDTTAGILYRIPDIVMAHPAKVFLMIGINDITFSLAKYYNNDSVEVIFERYKKIVDVLTLNEIKVIIQSTLNTSQKVFYDKERNDRVDKLNKLLKEYCKSNKIMYLDINSVLSMNGVLIGKYTKDGVHLWGGGV